MPPHRQQDEERKSRSMLGPYRALDISDERGLFCGKVLADLGCDVIKVEQPGGDPARNVGPFWHDIPHPERSLFWFVLNTSKRGITLNLETTGGKELFKRLVRSADFVIESFLPGYLDSIGLAYSVLEEINPRLILVSITPFGREGPYKDYKISDLVAQAMGGEVYVLGDPDRPPVRISYPQAYFNAGLEAAAGALTAHYYREMTGIGQEVIVSIQEAMVWAQQDAHLFWDLTKHSMERAGPIRRRPDSGKGAPAVWKCKDGYVSFIIIGGPAGMRTLKGLVDMMNQEGMADDFIKRIDWNTFDWTTVIQEEVDPIVDRFSRFFMMHTMDELLRVSIERKIMIYPVNTAAEIVKSPQLEARQFWQQVEHPELNTIIAYPGFLFKASESICKIWHRAPLIGEHNEDIYIKEFGFSREELVVLRETGTI
jgi:benzylsuccinate CoA-transferase BbsE subunit